MAARRVVRDAGVLLALGVLVLAAPDSIPALTTPGTAPMSDMSMSG